MLWADQATSGQWADGMYQCLLRTFYSDPSRNSSFWYRATLYLWLAWNTYAAGRRFPYGRIAPGVLAVLRTHFARQNNSLDSVFPRVHGNTPTSLLDSMLRHDAALVDTVMTIALLETHVRRDRP